MILQDILYKTNIQSIAGAMDLSITALAIDSRKVIPGSAFIAIKGTHVDGHQYISTAIQSGAVVIVAEKLPSTLMEHITYVQVENAAKAAGSMAHQFYGEPSTHLKLVGVTGTNGKTTIATLLFKLFSSLGYTCGLISTVENKIGDRVVPATHTTPDAIALNALLKDMVAAGCSHVFMESSSHAIHQHRIEGLKYTGGIFSNITHDHLDYHKTFDEYIKVKKSFFDQLPASAFAISNADDKRGAVMLQNTAAKKYFYGMQSMVAFKGKILDNNLTGLLMNINEQEVHFRMIGTFNAYNLLAVYGTAICLGEDKQEVLQHLSAMTGAEGRFDYFISPKEHVIAIVDYAHTPDALLNVLLTIKQLRKGHENIITVVGCGGDRDRTKRAIMAEVAAEHSDRLILTSDNPRTEMPESILSDMEQGLNTAAKRKSLTIVDRKEAIKTAILLSSPEDIILVAGKGHEKYQEINGLRHPFDDKAILESLMLLLEK